MKEKMKKLIPYILILLILVGVEFFNAHVAQAQAGQCFTNNGGSVADYLRQADKNACELNSDGSSSGYVWRIVPAPGEASPTANDKGTGLYNNLNSCRILPPVSLGGCFELIMYWIFYEIPSFLLGVTANFFDVIVALSLSSALYAKAVFIGSAWTIVRDLSNIFFILILLYIGVKTILGLGGSEVKKMVAHVVIMALLINFSMFFTKIIIDTSNILALIFYNKINVVQVTTTNGEKLNYIPVVSLAAAGVQDKDIAGGMMSYFDPTKILGKDFFDKFRQKTYQFTSTGAIASALTGAVVGSAIPIVGTGLGGVFGIIGYAFSGFANTIPTGIIVGLIIISGSIMAFAAYAFFIAGLAFLSRLIELWVLIIASPFALMSFSVPQLSHIEYIGWDNWSKRLLSISFMAPIFMFFLYLIFLIIQTKPSIFSTIADREGKAQGWMETIILLII